VRNDVVEVGLGEGPLGGHGGGGHGGRGGRGGGGGGRGEWVEVVELVGSQIQYRIFDLKFSFILLNLALTKHLPQVTRVFAVCVVNLSKVEFFSATDQKFFAPKNASKSTLNRAKCGKMTKFSTHHYLMTVDVLEGERRIVVIFSFFCHRRRCCLSRLSFIAAVFSSYMNSMSTSYVTTAGRGDRGGSQSPDF
jgi:hypothetical protein